MPGGGLTAIGLAGVVVSYSGIAHTFIDGMHALTGLLFFIGCIILGAGILDGGVSTTNRAKATYLVVISIALSFGAAGFLFNSVSTLPTFAGIMLLIAAPAIVISYMSMKIPEYVKPIGIIYILATIAGILAYVVFGVAGPTEYLIPQVSEVVSEEAAEIIEPTGPIFAIAILVGSSEQGNPDYEPDVAHVPQGHTIEWTNEDPMAHTVTSSLDFGETFDSGMMNEGDVYQLDTTDMAIGEYEYMCILHPWMISTIVVEKPQEPTIADVSIPAGAGMISDGQIYFDPEDITVQSGTTVVWTSNDNAVHTVTSGTPDDGPDGLFDSGMFSAGEKFEYTFSSQGTTDYYCIVHPWMVGTVTVE